MLTPPPFPDAGISVWDAWLDLHDARQPGMSGPGPLTFSEIDAYIRLTGNRLRSWQVEAIRSMDRVFRSVFSG